MLLELTPSESLFGIGSDEHAKTAEKLICLLDQMNISTEPYRENNCITLKTSLGELVFYTKDSAGYYQLRGLERMIEQNPDKLDIDLLESQLLPEMDIVDDYFCDLTWYYEELIFTLKNDQTWRWLAGGN